MSRYVIFNLNLKQYGNRDNLLDHIRDLKNNCLMSPELWDSGDDIFDVLLEAKTSGLNVSVYDSDNDYQLVKTFINDKMKHLKHFAIGRHYDVSVDADWLDYYPIVDDKGFVTDVIEADADTSHLCMVDISEGQVRPTNGVYGFDALMAD